MSFQPPYAGGFTPPPGPPGGWAPQAGQPPSAADHARQQVMGPAIGLMVVSGGAFFFYLFATVMVLFAGGMTFLGAGGSPADPGAALGMGIGAAMYVFWALAALVSFIGALRMKSLKSYGLSVASAVIAIVPCTTYVCCMLFMPFGIWAMIVLMKPEVKSQFS
jgi:hypothetical protein